MSTMTDPYTGLLSFQEALTAKIISPSPCLLHKDIFMLQDTPEGNQRLTYALIDDGVVKGTVVFIFAPPLNGEHCFGMAYSVAENFRKQGVGSDLVKRCLEEFKSGMKGKVKSYYIEALVGTNNIPSQKIASKLLSQTPKQTTDKVSGLPALHYTRLFSYP